MNYFSIGIHKKNVDLTVFFFISNTFSELNKGVVTVMERKYKGIM